LTALRKASARIWEARSASKRLNVDFQSLFNDVLALFDDDTDGFSIKRMQDELIGQMAELLEADYDTLTLEITETENRQRALTSDPSPHMPRRAEASAHPEIPSPSPTASKPPSAPAQAPTLAPAPQESPEQTEPPQTPSTPAESPGTLQPPDSDRDERLRGHIVSLAPTTERLQSIQRLVADRMGDALLDFEANVLRAIPVQAGGLYPISDVWYIEPGLDAPDRLRVHIAQFAHEIAEEVGRADHIESVEDGIGFICTTNVLVSDMQAIPFAARAVLTLLHALSAGYRPASSASTTLDNLRLIDALGPLLQGLKDGGKTQASRLSDTGLVKLFRLLRLARRLLELEADTGAGTAPPSDP